MLESTLPRHCYLDPAFLRREQRQIFAAEWFCVGRAESLAKVGAYRVVDVGSESVLIVRSAADQYRAFHNVCRHRGSQLVPQGDGAASSGCFAAAGIVCPYHSWRYGLDGELLHTPHLNIDRQPLGLHQIALAEWGGFVFVSLTEPRAPLADSLADIAERLVRYPLTELRVGQRIDYQVRANWKVLLENYNECYHCAGVHPELCQVVPAFRRRGGAELDWERGIPHRDGANTFTFSGTTERAPFPGLDEHEQTRHKGELIYPNLLLSLSMDHVAAFTLYPRAIDHTDIVCEFLFHPDEIAKSDFDPGDAVEFWDLTNRQDWAICESVQRGMNSMKFEHGYYAPMEDWSLDIREYVRQRIPDLSNEGKER